MNDLTNNEIEMVKAFTRDNFYDDGFYSTLWTDEFLEDSKINDLSINQKKGVLSSLSKKGYILVTGGSDSTISFLEPVKKILESF